jgi:signal transduction histidine kinase
MDAMIGATLMFARDQNADEAKRPTDLPSLLQSVVSDMREAGYAVQMREAEPIVYTCQPAALKRAVRNLLDNAVKYGKSGTIEVRHLSNAIEINVDDEGPGVPQQELTRVLEPFYRLEQSRSHETGGVGLGLAIAQAIVQSHGGSLRLTNRPTGGLRATIVLPD